VPELPFRLCLLLTRSLCRADPLEVVRLAVEGGVDCVQMREKEMSTAQRYHWGATLADLCRELQVPLIINDDVEVAMALGTEGVHLGQHDMPVLEARKLLGPDRWIGCSTHDLEQLDTAADFGADYAGFGPINPTGTKGYSRGLGDQALLQALLFARIPILAIGGIRPGNVARIPAQVGLAVSSAICAADDPRLVAIELAQVR
jgi:thiamine-phosphate pyrophosphorylase